MKSRVNKCQCRTQNGKGPRCNVTASKIKGEDPRFCSRWHQNCKYIESVPFSHPSHFTVPERQKRQQKQTRETIIPIQPPPPPLQKTEKKSQKSQQKQTQETIIPIQPPPPPLQKTEKKSQKRQQKQTQETIIPIQSPLQKTVEMGQKYQQKQTQENTISVQPPFPPLQKPIERIQKRQQKQKVEQSPEPVKEYYDILDEIDRLTFKAKFNDIEFQKLKPTNQLKSVTDIVDQIEYHERPWHGRVSGQRALWQGILKSENVNECLQTLIGLNSNALNYFKFSFENRVSYLITASPNWYNCPSPGCGEIGQSVNVKGMGQVPIKQEDPFVITIGYLKKALTFIQCLVNKNIIVPYEGTIKTIKSVNYLSLLKIVRDNLRKVNFVELGELTAGVAGGSTNPEPMMDQSYGVMAILSKIKSHLESLYPNYTDDQLMELMMGYGLVSHAIDTRHLVATLWFEYVITEGWKPKIMVSTLFENPHEQKTEILLHIRLLSVYDLLVKFGHIVE